MTRVSALNLNLEWAEMAKVITVRSDLTHASLAALMKVVTLNRLTTSIMMQKMVDLA